MRDLRRLTLALAAFVAICLGTSGVTYALWTSQASASSSVAAGTTGVTLSGVDALAVVYGGSTLSRSSVVTVLNSGTVAASYSTSVALTAGASSPLATATVVTAWPSPGDCSSVPSAALSGSWASVPSLTGTLAAGASAQWCVRTSITSAQASTLGATSITPEFTATVTIGSWTASSAPASFVQSVAAPAAAPVALIPPVNQAAWNLIHTTLSTLCVTPIYTSGSTLVQNSCTASDNFQLWRFALDSEGVGEIIQRGWNSTHLRWVANPASLGAVVTLSITSSSASRWVVLRNSNGTVSFSLADNPALCAAVSGSAPTSGAEIVLAACSGIAAQQFQVTPAANPTPAPVVLTCASENYNATFGWPQLTGYAGSVIYRVRLGDTILQANQYGGGNYDNPYVSFQNSTSSLVNDRSGNYVVTVEQSVNGTAWTTTGTGTLSITPGTWGGKFVNCG